MDRNTKVALGLLDNHLKRRIRPNLLTRARIIFDSAKAQLIREVKDHPVSRDLSSHNQNSSFVSGTSLFGFMGFNEGDTPVEDLVAYLNHVIRFLPSSQVIGKVDLRLPIIVNLPESSDFDNDGSFRMKWQSGVSWPVAIENGISGLPYYLHTLSAKGASRSGEGIQIASEIRSAEFVPVDYLTPIFNNFKRRVIGRQ